MGEDVVCSMYQISLHFVTIVKFVVCSELLVTVYLCGDGFIIFCCIIN
jgi:hypothetical protein